MEPVSDPPDAVPDAVTAAITTALDQVGSRLRAMRAQRGITLVEVSERTGISKSTLSRLENGQRRPTLELLLLLAQTYRVPLDDLVGAPDVGDPRIRLEPRKVKGRTVLPLTPRAGFRHGRSSSRPRSPRRLCAATTAMSGSTSSGRMRLILGDEDLTLGVGEAVEFDTTRPHWFGSHGDGPAEVLSLFGRPGERIHVRTSSHRQ